MNISLKRLSLSMLFLFLSFSVPVSAQTSDAGLRLITSPLPINLSGEPGTSITTDLKVKNDGAVTEKLQITMMKFRAYEDSGKPQLLEREEGDDFFDWVRFSEQTFTLAPNEWKTVTATFDIPLEASFGYYYAFVFSRAEDESTVVEKETSLVGGTAVLVLLEARVANAIRQVEVVEFSLDKKFYEFLPATFRVRLKNTGTVHIAPRGNIFINGSNKDVAILEINREKGNILPRSNREFVSVWGDGFPVYANRIEDGKVMLDEQGQAVKELSWDWKNVSKFRFGKYTAKMLLIYDDGKRDIPIEGEVSFWVIPWKILLGVLLILSFVFIGIRSTIRGIWQRLTRKNVTVS